MKQVSLWPSLSRIASRHPGIEPLEARIAPAAVVWNKDADGFWDGVYFGPEVCEGKDESK